MATKKWAKFPHDQKAITFSTEALKKQWADLHKGDCEPLPKEEGTLEAWRQFHAGNFQAAAEHGLNSTVGIKATAIYATYFESKEAAKLALYQEAMAAAEALMANEPKNPNAFYQYAYSAGRYSQGISIVKALSQGYGGKIKKALETCLKLDPKHAEAHTAMGAYHAEIIDKVGGMVGKLTYGTSKDVGLEHFEKAIKLNSNSPIAHIEYANGLMMLFGNKKVDEASALYEKAAGFKGRDAMEVLDIVLAKEELSE